MTRRDLIESSGAAVLTAVSQSRVLGANDRMSVALIGCGARGNLLLPHFQKLNKAPLTAVCDVWRTRAEKSQAQALGARLFGDHRKVLEMPGLDAVIIATPDHWHAPIAIDALNAGKDVYVEKPLTFRMEEGPRIVHAARANGRICQVGAQQRSGSHYIRARDEYIRSGKLGKIGLVRTWWFDGGGDSLGRRTTRPPGEPAGGHAAPPGLAHHGEATDRAFKSGQLDSIHDYLKRIRDSGMAVGVSSHMPAVFDTIESKGWDVDYFQTCLDKRHRSAAELEALLGQAPLPVGEVYLPKDPPRMFHIIQQTRKPCLAFKILAAGRRAQTPEAVEQAFAETFANLKPTDAVIVGMYDRLSDQPALNAAVVRRYAGSPALAREVE